MIQYASPGDTIALNCAGGGFLERTPERLRRINIWAAPGSRERDLWDKREREKASNAKQLMDLRFYETGLHEAEIGRETRRISNPSKSSSVTRVIRFSRDWTRTWEYEEEVGRTGGPKAQFGPDWLRAEGSISAAVKDRYAIKSSERIEHVEEVTVQVPPSSDIDVTLTWRPGSSCGSSVR